jgi:hypothetical protein
MLPFYNIRINRQALLSTLLVAHSNYVAKFLKERLVLRRPVNFVYPTYAKVFFYNEDHVKNDAIKGILEDASKKPIVLGIAQLWRPGFSRKIDEKVVKVLYYIARKNPKVNVVILGSKNMTTGEGGMIVTNDNKIAEKIRILRDQGQVAKYIHEELGYNYRMTNIQAAIGRVQLKRLEEMNNKRIENARYLTSRLSGVKGIIPPYVDPRVKHVFHQYVVRVTDEFPLTRDKLAEKLREKGVDTAIHYPIPVHQQPLYRRLGYPQNICPNAIDASRRVLSLPVHPLLTREELDYIVNAIKELAGE